MKDSDFLGPKQITGTASGDKGGKAVAQPPKTDRANFLDRRLSTVPMGQFMGGDLKTLLPLPASEESFFGNGSMLELNKF
jgi:hypothetical protein